MSNETIPGAKIDIHPSTSLKRNAFAKRSISSRIAASFFVLVSSVIMVFCGLKIALVEYLPDGGGVSLGLRIGRPFCPK
jgi:hypothetical protein